MRLAPFVISAAIAASASCAGAEGQFFFGDHPVRIEELKRDDVYAFLAADWAKFDKHAKEGMDAFTSKPHSVDWYLRITPPFPTDWPLQKSRRVTYYAYAEYQELFMHGPVLSRSAPWAKVVLQEGEPANKFILSAAIGPVVSGEGSVLISRQMADRKSKILKDGEAALPRFVLWTAVPKDGAQIKAIREYYCQWALTDRTADLIMDNHRAFFEWLSCPPRTISPVLPEIEAQP
jgi:hypothetical protein